MHGGTYLQQNHNVRCGGAQNTAALGSHMAPCMTIIGSENLEPVQQQSCHTLYWIAVTWEWGITF
jgi:hypothetical protein